MGLLNNLFGKDNKEKEVVAKVKWIPLVDVSQLETIEQESETQKVMIFKHSTRCSISSSVLNKFEKIVEDDVKLYYLDLLNYREISAAIAEKYQVTHQSPQLLVFNNKSLTYHASHYEIVS